MTKNDFTATPTYLKLQDHYREIAGLRMSDWFQEDTGRFEKYSLELENLLFDYSKNRINQTTMQLLLELALDCKVPAAIEDLFSGRKINITENRAALHTALRQQHDAPVLPDGIDIIPEVRRVQKQMRSFSDNVIAGHWKGYTGKPIQTVVNIGIGGSDLGPFMVTEALKPYRNHLDIHFVSNVDGSQIAEVLQKADPTTTLFLIASKTFTTQETMTNAHTARQWLLQSGASQEDIAVHFVAISTNVEAVEAFGISKANMFEMWDWVGGRFSLWSSIGLSICLAVGYTHFDQLLKGAFAADQHFRNSPLERNIPVIMALLGIWYNNFFGASTHAILPYDQYMHRFPAFLQQGDMESNGKSVDLHGNAVPYATGPVIWGEPGTNGQHAFFQLLHQGTQLVPADFIAPAQSQRPTGNHHAILLSNFFAQTEALMKGQSEAAVRAELEQQGLQPEEIERLCPFKVFEGNRPSNTFLLKKIDPYNLGMLIVLYEHKIFVQGRIWNINSFDQWGVELGKKLAGKILPELSQEGPTQTHDSSTNGLIDRYKQWR